MIFEIVLTPIFATINYLLTLLPVFPNPPEVTNAIVWVFSKINAFSFMLPTVEIQNALTIIFAYYAIVFTVSGTSWVFRKIPSLS